MNDRDSSPIPPADANAADTSQPDASAGERHEPAVTRREFIRASSAAAAAGTAFMIVPRHVLGQGMTAPSDLVNVAVVGIKGQGGANAQNLMSQNIVAICDVDDDLLEQRLAGWRRAAYPAANAGRGRGGNGGGGRAAAPSAWTNFGPSNAQKAADAKWTEEPTQTLVRRFVDEQIPRVAKYRDYRDMLEKQRDIDAVVVATPDHMHAVIALAAMSAGKHVYVQKPLCWSVQEARQLAKKAADNPKLVTQMGNQGHSFDDARRGQEYLMAGAIGDIREVHVWTNRPLGYWPQGVPRPAPLDPSKPLSWNNEGVERRLAAAMAGDYPVPATLDWNLFLGVAPEVPYHPIYHPFNWRGWVDWGQGALGDMGAHLLDHPVWGLKLGLPTTVETISTPFNKVSYPNATTTYYEFAARDRMPAMRMVWYDGGLMPPRPVELGEEHVDPAGGVLYIGSKGKMMQETYGNRPRLLPASLHNSYGAPKERLPRVPHQSHEMNWINAIRGRDEISCPFSYATHLTEIMLLGIASLRAGTKLQYDGAHMRVTNNPAANDYLSRQYRPGFAQG
jgi:predicted dehydrogenase